MIPEKYYNHNFVIKLFIIPCKNFFTMISLEIKMSIFYIFLFIDSQYNVTVKHAWKFHETHKDKWYLIYAKSEAVKQSWLKAIRDERQRVLEDQENGKISFFIFHIHFSPFFQMFKDLAIYLAFFSIFNPYHAKFLKWNNPLYIFGTVHYHF